MQELFPMINLSLALHSNNPIWLYYFYIFQLATYFVCYYNHMKTTLFTYGYK